MNSEAMDMMVTRAEIHQALLIQLSNIAHTFQCKIKAVLRIAYSNQKYKTKAMMSTKQNLTQYLNYSLIARNYLKLLSV